MCTVRWGALLQYSSLLHGCCFLHGICCIIAVLYRMNVVVLLHGCCYMHGVMMTCMVLATTVLSYCAPVLHTCMAFAVCHKHACLMLKPSYRNAWLTRHASLLLQHPFPDCMDDVLHALACSCMHWLLMFEERDALCLSEQSIHPTWMISHAWLLAAS